MSTSPRSQMETATEYLAASLGMSREQLIGQVVSQCLDEMRDQGTGPSTHPYVRLTPNHSPGSDSDTRLVVLPDDTCEGTCEELEVCYLEASNG